MHRDWVIHVTYFQSILRLLDVDEFIARLWQIHLAVKEQGYVQVPLETIHSLQDCSLR